MSELDKKIHLLGKVSFAVGELTAEQLEAVLAFIDYLKRRAGQ